MNTKLLQTRLNSIAHYKKQIQDLKDAQKVTTETLESVTKSLSEFCDLQENDLIVRYGIVYRFKSVSHVSNLELALKVEAQALSGGYGEQISWKEKLIYVPVTEMQNVKVIGNTDDDSFTPKTKTNEPA